jgi:two-component system, cell cycle sensor histidine kinase and response regulator CckA
VFQPPDTARDPLVESDPVAALRERDRRLESISDNFPEGALYQYTVAADGRRLFTYLGRGFERIFGELPATVPTDVAWLTARIHPDDEAGMAAAGDRSLRDLSRFDYEARIRAADGSERLVSFRSQPRRMADGTIVSDGIILDVTERRRAEQAVARRAEFLAALNATTLDLLGHRNIDELLQALAGRASALLRSPHAEISLLTGDELVVRAYSRGRDYLAGDRVRRDEPALSWRAVDTRKPVATANYSGDTQIRAVYRDRGIGAAVAIPVIGGEAVLGVLCLGRDQPGAAFSADDIDQGVLLAQMAALVLQNAAIYEDAVHEAEARTVALRESEERFRGVFDKSPLVIALLSVPEGRIVEVNAAAEAAFGYQRAEAIGRTSYDLELWVDPNLRDRYLANLKQDGAASGFEAVMRRKDGSTFTVLYSGSLVMIGGQPYSLNLLQDITARKQADAARERSLALMRATLESTADGILVVNADGHIETYNRHFAAMWRVRAEVSQPVSPADEERLLRRILRQLAEPEKFLSSVRDIYARSAEEVFDELRCKDGRLLERYSRPQLLGGQPAGRVWSFRDITKRRRAEAALRESEERFRVLAEVSPAGIFRTDPEGRCTFVNGRWCEIAGLTSEQAMGEGWQRALHPEDRDRVAGNWTGAVRVGGPSTEEFRFVRPDGTIAWLVGQSRPERRADDTFAGYVGTITDVTEIKRAEEERKVIEAQLRQSRKMESLGTLAGGIAHDFNNILNGTFGFVDLARLELPEGHPAHAWLDRIAGSSQRARELVRQILTFSRKNEGERTAQRLQPVVAEALRLLRSSLPAMVELVPEISAATPPVLADPTQIHQVVINLCTNAWHALPSRGGRITVKLEPCTLSRADTAAHPELRPGQWARLTVADTGCGMEPATLEHIFEPFFTTKEPGAGTGLGLAVVHGIIQSHDGAIVVRSVPGTGTTFELYFPAVAAAPERPPDQSLPPPRGHGQRIMVVDDDPVSGFALEKIIESLGYHVTRLMRPEEALARFTDAPSSCDLVVSDLAMPGMSGAELIEHLVKVRPDIPIIVASGYVDTTAARLLEKSPARAVLRKPVSRDELARAIARELPR